MSRNLLTITGILILGLQIGCSSDGGEPASQVIVVAADGTNDGNSTTGANADSGSVTGADTGSQTSDAGDDAAGETTSATTGADTTSGNTDSSTADDGTGTATTGTLTDGTTTTTAGSTTEGTTTDTGTDGVNATTGTATATAGSADDAGTTDGTATATDGTTAGTDTDAGLDSAGTADTTSGTTAGTGTDGTGTTTGGSAYPIGSLAYLIENEEDLSSALVALQVEGFDLALNDPTNAWTVFLPNNDALDVNSTFDFQAHVFVTGPLLAQDLTRLDAILMNDNQVQAIDGGVGTQPLTIAGANIVTEDLVGNTGETVVHIIDAVIGEDMASPYPAGSLADVLFSRGDMTNVLEALTSTDVDLNFNDPIIEWTLFLPNDSALDDPDDFDSDTHIYSFATIDSESLSGITGSSILMNSGNFIEIGGGGIEPFTIGGIDIIESDIQNEDNDGSVVHIIDGVLQP